MRELAPQREVCYPPAVRRELPEQRLFFVVGRGRSGTTLLSRMLGRHPALAVAPEGFFVMNLRRRYGRGAWSEPRVEAFCRDLVTENRMAAWGLDLVDVAARLRANLPGLTFPRACAEVYFSYAQTVEGRAAVQLVGDKNPHYGLFADQLCQLFPAARLVHIVRDPRDNVMSYQQVPFDLNDTAALAARWCHYQRAIGRACQRYPERVLRLRYEDLVAEPEDQLTRVCRFLGIDFDPEMLAFFAHQPGQFYGEGSAWFDNLSRPVDAGQAQKWATQMDPHDRAIVEALCADPMRRFGYPLGTAHTDGPAGLGWRQRLGALLGSGSVAAERVIFGALPPALRTWGINTYRSRTGRV